MAAVKAAYTHARRQYHSAASGHASTWRPPVEWEAKRLRVSGKMITGPSRWDNLCYTIMSLRADPWEYVCAVYPAVASPMQPPGPWALATEKPQKAWGHAQRTRILVLKGQQHSLYLMLASRIAMYRSRMATPGLAVAAALLEPATGLTPLFAVCAGRAAMDEYKDDPAIKAVIEKLWPDAVSQLMTSIDVYVKAWGAFVPADLISDALTERMRA